MTAFECDCAEGIYFLFRFGAIRGEWQMARGQMEVALHEIGRNIHGFSVVCVMHPYG